MKFQFGLVELLSCWAIHVSTNTQINLWCEIRLIPNSNVTISVEGMKGKKNHHNEDVKWHKSDSVMVTNSLHFGNTKIKIWNSIGAVLQILALPPSRPLSCLLIILLSKSKCLNSKPSETNINFNVLVHSILRFFIFFRVFRFFKSKKMIFLFPNWIELVFV